MSAPPSLPPRPGRPAPPPVDEPEELYDDCDEANGIPPHPEDEYDDFEVESPPPLPPHPEVYDDIGQQDPPPPPPPQRPKAGIPLMTLMKDDGGPIVQQLHKRPQPPPPAPSPATHHHRPPPSHPPLPSPPPLHDETEAIYEVEPNVDPDPAVPPAPFLPPKTPHHPPPLPPTPNQGPPLPPPHPPRETPQAPKAVKSPKGGEAPTGFAMSLGDLQDIRKGLRRVSQDSASGAPEPSPQSTTHDPKIYGACPENVQVAKNMFENRSQGKPDVLSPKPQLAAKPDPSQSASKASRDTGPSGDGPKITRVSPNQPSHAGSKPQQAVRPVPKPDPLPEAPEDIYDDAASIDPDPLMRYDWYHGIINRSAGEKRVNIVGKDGTFLVRVSEKDPKFPFTLVVLHNGATNNLRIRSRADGQVALGDEKTGEVAFKDVPALIDHHRQHNVVLLGNNQSHVKLQHPAPKS